MGVTHHACFLVMCRKYAGLTINDLSIREFPWSTDRVWFGGGGEEERRHQNMGSNQTGEKKPTPHVESLVCTLQYRIMSSTFGEEEGKGKLHRGHGPPLHDRIIAFASGSLIWAGDVCRRKISLGSLLLGFPSSCQSLLFQRNKIL